MTQGTNTLAELLPGLFDDIYSKRQPIKWVLGKGHLADIRMGPEQMLSIAGPTGIAKTSLIMQMVIHAMLTTPDLRVLVCNVEMSERELMERLLAHVCRVKLDDIMDRTTTREQDEQLRAGVATLASIGPRLKFCKRPEARFGQFTMKDVIDNAVEQDSNLIVLDYIQRFKPSPDSGGDGDTKTSMNVVMSEVRGLALAGCGIIMGVAVNRGKNGNYTDLGAGSMRDSSELEYACNNAFIMEEWDANNPDDRRITHIKARNRKKKPFRMKFDGDIQRFKSIPWEGAT